MTSIPDGASIIFVSVEVSRETVLTVWVKSALYPQSLIIWKKKKGFKK